LELLSCLWCSKNADLTDYLAIVLKDIALHDIGNSTLAYANIIGCNLGSEMTPLFLIVIFLNTFADTQSISASN